MCKHPRTPAALLLTLVVTSVLTCGFQSPEARTSLRQAGKPELEPIWVESRVPGDKAIIDFLVPAGGQIQLDGKAVSSPVEIGPLPKDRVETKTFRVRLPDGRTFERTVLVQAGWRIEVPVMAPPSADRKEPRRAGSVSDRRTSEPPPPSGTGTGSEVVMQRGHSGGVTAVAFGADGQFALTGGTDDLVILWETATGRQLRSFKGPANIGPWHAVSMADAAGKQLLASVVGVAFSKNDNEILMAGAGGGIIRAERATGKELAQHWPPAATDRRAAGSPLGWGTIYITPQGSHILWDLCRFVAVAPSTARFERFYGRPADRSAKATQVSGGMNARPLHGIVSENGEVILLAKAEGLSQWSVWDGNNGKQLAKLPVKDSETRVGAITADGKLGALACSDAIHLYELPSGQERGRLEYPQEIRNPQGFNAIVKALLFSSDGRQIAAGAQGGVHGSAAIWEVAEGKVRHVLPLGKTTGIVRDETPVPWISLAFSPDGKRLLTGTISSGATIWDVASGRQLYALGSEGETAHLGSGTSPELLADTEVEAVALRPDGRQIAAAFADGTVYLWGGVSGRQAVAFQATAFRPDRAGNTRQQKTLTYSHDSRYLVTAGKMRAAATQVWNTATGLPASLNVLESGEALGGAKLSVVFHPDGKRVFVGDGSAWLGFNEFEPRLLQSAPHAQVHFSGAPLGFLPGGRQLLCRVRGSLAIWDVANGHLVWPAKLKLHPPFTSRPPDEEPAAPEIDSSLPAEAKAVLQEADRDGPYDPERKAKAILDSQILQRLKDRVGQADASTRERPSGFNPDARPKAAGVPFAVRADGRMFVTGGADGIVHLWDTATGDELARLYAVGRSGNWAAVTSEGLFDGTRVGREQVTFRAGANGQVVPLDYYFQTGYYPGLLPALLPGERPFPDNLMPRDPAPIVKVLANPASGGNEPKERVILDITVTDQGGGCTPPTLRHNHALVRVAAQGQTDGKNTRYRVPLTLVAGDNRIDVRSSTADGRLESKPAVVNVKFDGKISKPDFYVIAVGINRYDAGWQQVTDVPPLTYAVSDAKAMVESLRRHSSPLFGELHVVELYDTEATRARILKAVSEARRARPDDVLLLYVAGHGKTVGDRFYLIPNDARGGAAVAAATSKPSGVVTGVRGAESASDKGIRANGLAVDELAEALADVPALRRVLIFDTCSSGSAATLAGRRQNPFAVRGAVERVQHSQGVYCLAAAPAGVAAKEPAELAGGVLTYSLLAALGSAERGPLRSRRLPAVEHVGVLEWFKFANKEVPELYQSLAGLEQPVVMSGEDQPDFPLLVLRNRP